MKAYDNPAESVMYIEALSLAGLHDMFQPFAEDMPTDQLDIVNVLMIANSSMVNADIDRSQRYNALRWMAEWLKIIQKENGILVSEGWVMDETEDAA